MLVRELVIPELEESVQTRRYWTEEEDSVIRRYYGKADSGKIAAHLNRTKRAVQNRASDLGVSNKPRGINQ